MVIKQKMKKES